MSNLQSLKGQINQCVASYNKSFMRQYKDNPDFGCCGSAVVLIGFGRKKKLKQLFDEAGMLGSEWEYCGKKMYVLEYNRNGGVAVPTQYIGYYAHRAELVVDVLKNWFISSALDNPPEVYAHSWVD